MKISLYRRLWIKYHERAGREVVFNTSRRKWEAYINIPTAFGKATVLEGVTSEELEESLNRIVAGIRERAGNENY